MVVFVLCLGNTDLKPKNIHECTRLVRSSDGIGVMSIMDLVLVKRNMPKYMDLKTVNRNVKPSCQVHVWREGRTLQ